MAKDMYEHAYFRVQAVLDEALGDGEDAGSGEGIAGDVYLLMAQRNKARELLRQAIKALREHDPALAAQLEALADG